MQLLIGTTNSGKIVEVQEVLKGLAVTLVLPNAFATWPQVEEDGETFEDNALKKGRILANFSGLVTLADDSGLEVDFLHGAPGIHSARYSGPAGNDVRNNEKLLHALSTVPWDRRGARFVCALALCVPISSGGKHWSFRGECSGRISFEPRGNDGFGYDPLFFYPPLNRTFAELDRKTKCSVSHRGAALRELRKTLPSLLP